MRPISCQKANKQKTNPAPTKSEVLGIGIKSGIDSELGFCQVNIMKGEKARVIGCMQEGN